MWSYKVCWLFQSVIKYCLQFGLLCLAVFVVAIVVCLFACLFVTGCRRCVWIWFDLGRFVVPLKHEHITDILFVLDKSHNTENLSHVSNSGTQNP